MEKGYGVSALDRSICDAHISGIFQKLPEQNLGKLVEFKACGLVSHLEQGVRVNRYGSDQGQRSRKGLGRPRYDLWSQKTV